MEATTTYAFFDVDDTIVRLKTMFSFQDYYFRHAGFLPGLFGARRSKRFDALRRSYLENGRPREDINRMYYRSFRGREPDTVAKVARQWYDHILNRPGGLYFPAVLHALRGHQAAGHEIVFVSGSMVPILRPIAEELRVEHVIATRVIVDEGRYTGKIIPPRTIGTGKARAVKMFMAAREIDGSACWAYADDASDVPMLSLVGHPVVVSTRPEMAAEASSRGWLPIDPERPASRSLPAGNTNEPPTNHHDRAGTSGASYRAVR